MKELTPADRAATLRLRARVNWALAHPIEAAIQWRTFLDKHAATTDAAIRARLMRQ